MVLIASRATQYNGTVTEKERRVHDERSIVHLLLLVSEFPKRTYASLSESRKRYASCDQYTISRENQGPVAVAVVVGVTVVVGDGDGDGDGFGVGVRVGFGFGVGVGVGANVGVGVGVPFVRFTT